MNIKLKMEYSTWYLDLNSHVALRKIKVNSTDVIQSKN